MIPNTKHWISFGNCWSFKIIKAGDQGSPTPRPWKGMGPRCLRRWATEQEVSCRRASEQSFLRIYSHSPLLALPLGHRTTSPGLPLILHYGELQNYIIAHHNVIIIEIKCTKSVMCLNHPEIIPHPSPWKNGVPRKWSLVPKRLETTDLQALTFRWVRGQ